MSGASFHFRVADYDDVGKSGGKLGTIREQQLLGLEQSSGDASLRPWVWI